MWSTIINLVMFLLSMVNVTFAWVLYSRGAAMRTEGQNMLAKGQKQFELANEIWDKLNETKTS